MSTKSFNLTSLFVACALILGAWTHVARAELPDEGEPRGSMEQFIYEPVTLTIAQVATVDRILAAIEENPRIHLDKISLIAAHLNGSDPDVILPADLADLDNHQIAYVLYLMTEVLGDAARGENVSQEVAEEIRSILEDRDVQRAVFLARAVTPEFDFIAQFGDLVSQLRNLRDRIAEAVADDTSNTDARQRLEADYQVKLTELATLYVPAYSACFSTLGPLGGLEFDSSYLGDIARTIWAPGIMHQCAYPVSSEYFQAGPAVFNFSEFVNDDGLLAYGVLAPILGGTHRLVQGFVRQARPTDDGFIFKAEALLSFYRGVTQMLSETPLAAADALTRTGNDHLFNAWDMSMSLMSASGEDNEHIRSLGKAFFAVVLHGEIDLQYNLVRALIDPYDFNKPYTMLNSEMVARALASRPVNLFELAATDRYDATAMLYPITQDGRIAMRALIQEVLEGRIGDMALIEAGRMLADVANASRKIIRQNAADTRIADGNIENDAREIAEAAVRTVAFISAGLVSPEDVFKTLEPHFKGEVKGEAFGFFDEAFVAGVISSFRPDSNTLAFNQVPSALESVGGPSVAGAKVDAINLSPGSEGYTFYATYGSEFEFEVDSGVFVGRTMPSFRARHFDPDFVKDAIPVTTWINEHLNNINKVLTFAAGLEPESLYSVIYNINSALVPNLLEAIENQIAVYAEMNDDARVVTAAAFAKLLREVLTTTFNALNVPEATAEQVKIATFKNVAVFQAAVDKYVPHIRLYSDAPFEPTPFDRSVNNVVSEMRGFIEGIERSDSEFVRAQKSHQPQTSSRRRRVVRNLLDEAVSIDGSINTFIDMFDIVLNKPYLLEASEEDDGQETAVVTSRHLLESAKLTLDTL